MLNEDEHDDVALAEFKNVLTKLVERVDQIELQSLLSGKYDATSCYFSLNAGAGGTDAQDWNEMLLRMYLRWMEKKGFKTTIIDQTDGDEAGIKSVTVHVVGEFAYGYLKNEVGIHRLVRLSPFNANNKRQTSFAACDVIPEMTQDNLTIDIDTKDLRIDTYRASGAGGQHVNKTDSAVRITHLPTGLVAQSQQSRSQTANKETAMGILKARILVLLEKQEKEKIQDLRGDVKDIAWGNQIRSYVFHPYKLVKDLRTNVETSQLQAVMDGDIDVFIEEHLKYSMVKGEGVK